MAAGDPDAAHRAVAIAHRVLAHMGIAAGACPGPVLAQAAAGDL